jgi:hypothetical protein
VFQFHAFLSTLRCGGVGVRHDWMSCDAQRHPGGPATCQYPWGTMGGHLQISLLGLAQGPTSAQGGSELHPWLSIPHWLSEIISQCPEGGAKTTRAPHGSPTDEHGLFFIINVTSYQNNKTCGLLRPWIVVETMRLWGYSVVALNGIIVDASQWYFLFLFSARGGRGHPGRFQSGRLFPRTR